MATESWSTPSDKGSVLTTELNSLSNGSFSSASAAVDNATDKARFGQAELNVTYGTNPTAKSVCELYAVPSLDGTNYSDGGGAVNPSDYYYLGSFQLRATTSAQRVTSGIFELPPFKFKLVLKNAAGQTTAGSGNTVNLKTFNRVVS